jgi:hypothetical protein
MRLVLGHDEIPPPDWLRDAAVAAVPFVRQVVDSTRRRSPYPGRAGKVRHLERCIAAEAWADVALALIDLELPQWRLRRLVYDGGEWHCALARHGELPEWLDQSVEARHCDLSLALLEAFLEAQQIACPAAGPSVPATGADIAAFCTPLCCDNFK